MNYRTTQLLRGTLALATLGLSASLALAQTPAPANGSAPDSAPVAPNVQAPSAHAADATPGAPPAPSESASYSVGLVFGNQLRSAGLEQSLNVDDVINGLKAGLGGRALNDTDKEHAMQLVRSGRDALATRNHAAAKDYLAKNAAAPGVVTTASGLQYQVIDAGNAKAASPLATDRVTVHYRGRLLDGTEFDSSDAHAQAATFSVGAVIKGWREALLLMKPGAKWRLFIPPELAYDLNSPPTIPPGSMLIFDVELLKVEAAPAMSPQTPKAPKAQQKDGKPSTTAKPAAKPATGGT